MCIAHLKQLEFETKRREKKDLEWMRSNISSPPQPAIPPSSWPEDSPISFSSSASPSSSLPCAQGCSPGKGRPYLPLTQPPRINVGHRCCTAQTHTHTNCSNGLKIPVFFSVNPCFSICLRLYMSLQSMSFYLSVSVSNLPSV